MCIILPLLPSRSPTTTTISRSYHLQPRYARCASCCHYCTFMGQTDVHKKFRLFTKFSSHFKQIVHPVYSGPYSPNSKQASFLVPVSRRNFTTRVGTCPIQPFSLPPSTFAFVCPCFLSSFFCLCSVSNTLKHGYWCFPWLRHIFCDSSRKLRPKWIVNYAWNFFVVRDRITATQLYN